MSSASNERGRSRIRLIVIKLGVSALFLGFLAFKIDLRDLWTAAVGVHRGFYVAAFLLTLVNQVLIAVRLEYLLRPTTIRLPVLRLLRVGYIIMFYAMFLPAGIGMAVVRWYKITENKYGRVQFLVVSVIEKSLFLLVTLFFVGVPLLGSSDPRIRHIRLGIGPVLVVMAIVLFVGFYVMLASKKRLGWFERMTAALKAWLVSRMPRLESVFGDLRIYRGRLDVLSVATLLSIAIQAVIIANITLLFWAVGVHLSLPTHILIASLVFLIQVMPISFAGLGVRETAFAYAFGLYGLQQEAGALVGLLVLLQLLMTASIGGVLELTDRGHW